MTEVNPQTGEVVTSRSPHPVWDAVKTAATRAERIKASREAVALVTLPNLANPVPAFFLDLPWQATEQAQMDIIARAIGADTLEEAMAPQEELPDFSTYVGKTVTILEAVARRGTIAEAWGAYLSLQLLVAGEDEVQVANTSSAEVCALVWRAYCEGKLPLTALVILKGNPVPGRNQPIGLVAETPFDS